MLRAATMAIVGSLIALALNTASAVADDGDGASVGPGGKMIHIEASEGGSQSSSVVRTGATAAGRTAGAVERPLTPEEAFNRACPDGIYLNTPGTGSCPPADPAPGQQNRPDAARLAQKARGQINFKAPRIGLSPVPPNPAIVNLQTWLWLDGGSWTPREGSVTAGNTTVTATAEPVSVRWDMGEGTTLCQGPGRKWVPGLGQGTTSSCGFTYRHTSNNQPGDKYEISATVHYKASWKCEGDCSEAGGDLGLIDAPTATTGLKVTERQTVVTYP